MNDYEKYGYLDAYDEHLQTEATQEDYFVEAGYDIITGENEVDPESWD